MLVLFTMIHSSVYIYSYHSQFSIYCSNLACTKIKAWYYYGAKPGNTLSEHVYFFLPVAFWVKCQQHSNLCVVIYVRVPLQMSDSNKMQHKEAEIGTWSRFWITHNNVHRRLILCDPLYNPPVNHLTIMCISNPLNYSNSPWQQHQWMSFIESKWYKEWILHIMFRCQRHIMNANSFPKSYFALVLSWFCLASLKRFLLTFRSC